MLTSIATWPLRWPDIDLESRLAILRETKNGHERTIALHPNAIEILRMQARVVGRDRVFDESVTASNISPQFRRLCKRLGIKGLRLHDLRHTAASALVRGGVAVPTVMAQGGWRSEAAFKRYANMQSGDLVAAVDRMQHLAVPPPDAPGSGRLVAFRASGSDRGLANAQEETVPRSPRDRRA